MGRGGRRRRGEIRVGGKGEAEEGPDAEGEAAEVAKGKAEEEIEHLIGAEPLRIARYVLARIRRQLGHRYDCRAVEHHFDPIFQWMIMFFLFLFFFVLDGDAKSGVKRLIQLSLPITLICNLTNPLNLRSYVFISTRSNNYLIVLLLWKNNLYSKLRTTLFDFSPNNKRK